MEVTRERWEEAQELERTYHNYTLKEGIKIYGKGYRTYLFKYLDINYKDMQGKNVLEIGPADFPAIYFCKNLGLSCVIEPMDSPILEELSKLVGFTILKALAEEAEFPFVDETWMFNLLTHVMNPDLIIEKAKNYSDVIRFFEPVYSGISLGHPWSFNFDYFRDRFGRGIHYYPPNDTIQGFHAHECAYGIWRKNNV